MDKYRRRIAFAMVTIGLIAPLGGCRICADCEDLAYPAYGGAWERTRRDSGRVGSVFDPAGGQSPLLVDRDHPPTPDALERERQSDGEDGFDLLDRDRDSSSPDSPPSSEDTQDLLERELDDIRNDQEESLRNRELDDIEVRLIPRDSAPTTLR